MIVFLSDLHFSDGTAGPPNVPAGAFEGAFEDIGKMAKDAGAEQLEIVYLGDVVDLIRTTAWQNFPIEARPWGQRRGVWTAQQDRATHEVLDGVLDAAAAALKVLRSSPLQGATTRTFIPGNHDRIVNLSPSLRAKMKKALGLQSDVRKPFAHFYASARAKTFARHGHEFDAFNFAGSRAFSTHRWSRIPDADYNATPIGDLLAAEVSARLPAAVLAHLDPNHPDRNRLEKHLKEIFDVRPIYALFSYLAYQARRFNDPAVTAAINKGFQEVINDFAAIPFVQQWIVENDRWYNPFDRADKLQYVLALSKIVNFANADSIAHLVEKFAWIHRDDNLASDALGDFERLDSAKAQGVDGLDDIRFVMYGHTHSPDQRLISMIEGEPRMYLNTGMWRPMNNEGLRGDFSPWDTLCYTTIYEPGEFYKTGARCEHPMFEVWTGGLGREG